jgi:hypothetical protein
VWVIFDNGEFNIIKKFLLNLFNDQAFMQFDNPDFVKYADSCRAFGARVEKLEDFDAVFKKRLPAVRRRSSMWSSNRKCIRRSGGEGLEASLAGPVLNGSCQGIVPQGARMPRRGMLALIGASLSLVTG